MQDGLKIILVLVLRKFIAKICAKDDFRVSAHSDLDLRPFDVKVALPITSDVGHIYSKFELVRLSIVELTVGTDRRTDVRI